MEQAQSIPRKEPSGDVLDYEYLKRVATEVLQGLSGKIWTDYNLHDPGVTLLEILAYAVTETGYRLDFPIRDLLFNIPIEVAPRDTLQAPEKVLPSAPVTARDYNRLFLNIPGVRMASIRPSLQNPDYKGLFDIEIQLEEGAKPSVVRAALLDLFHGNRLGAPSSQSYPSNRNLCEDLHEIRFLEETPIRFHIGIQIEESVDRDLLIPKIASVLKEYLSPPIRYYRKSELLAQGIPMEEILNGPELTYGFVPDQDFDKLSTRSEIRTSDVFPILIAVDGVEEVQQVQIQDRFNIYHDWVCQVEGGKAPRLDAAGSSIELFNRVGTSLGSYTLLSNREMLTDLTQLRTTQRIETPLISKGKFRDLAAFHSLQNEFPRIYGIGDTGLPSAANKARQGEAKQLQGFVLFFEQCLGNFFAQLASLNKFYSLDEIDQSQFYQPLLDVPGAEYLYQPFVTQFIERHVSLEDHAVLQREWKVFRIGFLEWKKFQAEMGSPHSEESTLKECWERFTATQLDKTYLDAIITLDKQLYQAVETREDFLVRRNKVLDHLLARYAIDALDYHFSLSGNVSLERRIQDKLMALKSFPDTSLARGIGANFGPQANQNGQPSEPEKLNLNESVLETELRQIFHIPAKEEGATKSRVMMGKPKAGEVDQIEIRMLKSNPDEAFRNLFHYGVNGQAFSKDSSNNFLLRNDSGQHLATLSGSKALMQQTFADLANYIQQLGDNSECLYLIEHILLRPDPASSRFGFVIRSPRTQAELFASNDYLSWREREDRLKVILDLGRDRSNYEIREVGVNQFKVGLTSGSSLLSGPEYFKTPEEVGREIEVYEDAFQRLYSENLNKENKAEKIFRLREEGKLKGGSDGKKSLELLFEAGVNPANYQEWKAEEGTYLQILHPDSGTIFQSYQCLQAKSLDELKNLVVYFREYCVNHFRFQYIKNVYDHPAIDFRTAHHDLFIETDDPYSHIATLILPDWTPRFQQEAFRSRFEKMAFTKTPAHLVLNIRWFGFKRMERFIPLYQSFLTTRIQYQTAKRNRDVLLDELSDHDLPKVKVKSLRKKLPILESKLKKLGPKLSAIGEELIELIA